MRRFLSFIGTVIVVLSMVFGYVFYVRGNLAKEDLEVMTGLRDELKEENSSLKEENEKLKKELEAKKKAEVKENTVKKEETKTEEVTCREPGARESRISLQLLLQQLFDKATRCCREEHQRTGDIQRTRGLYPIVPRYGARMQQKSPMVEMRQ